MKKIIIFGGYGYIGRHLYDALKQKYNVKRFRNKLYHKKKIGIVYNLYNFKKYINKFKPDIIFFLSGNSYPGNSTNDHAYDFERSNKVLQEFLKSLTLIKFKGQLIFSSSIAVYGLTNSKSKKAVKEDSHLEPLSFYGLSKVIAEKQLEFFSRKYNINILILRISSVYGLDLKRQLVYDVICQIKSKSKKNIVLQGNNKDKRQMIFIEDVIIIMEKLIKYKYKFKILNLAQGKKYLVSNIVHYLLEQSFIKSKVVFKSKTKSIQFPILNNNNLMKEIGNFRFTTLKKGLKKTLNYFNN